MADHPQYAMWKARYDAERSALAERAAWRAGRDVERAGWREAWRSYRAHRQQAPGSMISPPWWNLWAWLRFLRRGAPSSQPRDADR